MLLWLILLACIVFFMYMWNSDWVKTSPSSGGCNVCGNGKNRNVE